MQSNQVPTKFPIPFATSAGSGYKRAVPQASQIGITPGAASLTDGFPPVCFQPVGSGGVPPSGQDFNGLLNQVSAWAQWQAAGAPLFYDSNFSAAIGGYPMGAVLQSTSTVGSYWLNLVENNPTNPDAGGANWTGFSVLVSNQISSIYTTLITNYPSLLPPRNILTSISAHGTGSITVPANVTEIFYRLLGAGGGGGPGGGSFSNYCGGGGGSGGYAEGWIAVTPGQVLAYTVGQGGAGATTNGTPGGTGGTSTFGPATCTGGGGGQLTFGGGTTTASGGAYGLGSGGQVNFAGAAGGDGNPFVTQIQGGAGAASAFGGGGRTATAGLPGRPDVVNGVAPGSGGGGVWGTGTGNQQGGNGADGALIVSY